MSGGGRGGQAAAICQQQQVMLSGCPVNKVSRAMMSSGVCVVDVMAELLSGGQVEVRAELSDGSFLQLNRTDEDLARMLKRLVDGCLDDRETLSFSLLTGVFRTSDPETKTVEMNSLLKSVINLPHEFSQSEAVLAFFEPSAGDQISRRTEDQILEQEENQTLRLEAENQTSSREQDQSIREEDQDLSVFQSLVGLSEIMTSNGFCLANTETILFDLTPPTHHVTQSDDSSGRRASIGAAVCLELCRPSVSPHLLRGFTGMMGRLVNRRNLRHRSAQPPCPASSTCCSPGLRRQTSWTE